MPLHFTPNSCAHIRPQGDAEVKARLLDQACWRGIHARPYGAAHPQDVAVPWAQHHDHVQHAQFAAEAMADAGRVRQRWNGIA
eukprot:7380847-Prymnesium_polylepis.2